MCSSGVIARTAVVGIAEQTLSSYVMRVVYLCILFVCYVCIIYVDVCTIIKLKLKNGNTIVGK